MRQRNAGHTDAPGAAHCPRTPCFRLASRRRRYAAWLASMVSLWWTPSSMVGPAISRWFCRTPTFIGHCQKEKPCATSILAASTTRSSTAPLEVSERHLPSKPIPTVNLYKLLEQIDQLTPPMPSLLHGVTDHATSTGSAPRGTRKKRHVVSCSV